MRKDILIKRVKAEAKKLKKFATIEQIRSLNFDRLYPESASLCIYGQMTGYCFSYESLNLICKCAERVYTIGEGNDLKKSNHKLNGALTKPLRDIGHYSPIEIFIAQPENQGTNNKILIDYLKGNRKNLRFAYPKKRG